MVVVIWGYDILVSLRLTHCLRELCSCCSLPLLPICPPTSFGWELSLMTCLLRRSRDPWRQPFSGPPGTCPAQCCAGLKAWLWSSWRKWCMPRKLSQHGTEQLMGGESGWVIPGSFISSSSVCLIMHSIWLVSDFSIQYHECIPWEY